MVFHIQIMIKWQYLIIMGDNKFSCKDICLAPSASQTKMSELQGNYYYYDPLDCSLGPRPIIRTVEK